MESINIIPTADNSHTLFNSELNETYHSKHGAVTESQHVFIKNGLHFYKDFSNIKIFEVGFGTGLNAWLTAIESERLGISIEYHTIEKYPVSHRLALSLNYYLWYNEHKSLFEKLHLCDWGKHVDVHRNFLIHKIHGDLVSYAPTTEFNIIYFDAFAPEKQPEMWNMEVLQKMYSMLANSGRLVTYCAQGHFKRHLKAIGFKVTATTGSPGKREMTVAVK